MTEKLHTKELVDSVFRWAARKGHREPGPDTERADGAKLPVDHERAVTEVDKNTVKLFEEYLFTRYGIKGTDKVRKDDWWKNLSVNHIYGLKHIFRVVKNGVLSGLIVGGGIGLAKGITVFGGLVTGASAPTLATAGATVIALSFLLGVTKIVRGELKMANASRVSKTVDNFKTRYETDPAFRERADRIMSGFNSDEEVMESRLPTKFKNSLGFLARGKLPSAYNAMVYGVSKRHSEIEELLSETKPNYVPEFVRIISALGIASIVALPAAAVAVAPWEMATSAANLLNGNLNDSLSYAGNATDEVKSFLAKIWASII